MPTRPTAAKILPRRVRRRDAEDVADELIAQILLHRERYALFVLPNGEFKFCAARAIRFQDWCERWPTSLCGIYDDDVMRADLIEDVLGMEGTRQWRQ